MLPRLIKVVTNGSIVFSFNAESHSIVKLPRIDFENVLKLRKPRSNCVTLEKTPLRQQGFSLSAREAIYS